MAHNYDSNGSGGHFYLLGHGLSAQNKYYKNVYSPDPTLMGVKQTISATWDKTGKLVDGTWRTLLSNGATGKFTMSRVN